MKPASLFAMPCQLIVCVCVIIMMMLAVYATTLLHKIEKRLRKLHEDTCASNEGHE